MGCGTNLYLAYVKRQLSGFVGNFDTGLTQQMYPQQRPCACGTYLA